MPAPGGRSGMVDSAVQHDGRLEVLTRYFDASLDFSRRLRPPALRCLIAAVPRSGSTALGLEMWRTGLLGAPLEYTNPALNRSLVERLGAKRRPDLFWRRLHAVRTSSNGVFGHKIFVPTLMQLARQGAAINRGLEADRVICLTRRNRVAQAVSYCRAMRSGVWAGRAPEPSAMNADMTFDRQQIAHALALIDQQCADWERLFRAAGTEPLRIDYEDFLANPDAAVGRILDFVLCQRPRVHRPRSPVPVPPLLVQRDALSDQWTQLFRDPAPRPQVT